MQSSRIVLRLFWLACAACVSGWRTWGTLPVDGIFASYVGKFCFDYKRGPGVEAGRFKFKLSGRMLSGPHETALPSTEGPPCWGPCETQGNLYLLVFDDEEDHWQRARRHWNSLTCEEMLHYASFAMPLSPLDREFNRTVYVHESLRPRFWYFTFAGCGVSFVEPVTYEIHTENILEGFQSEFGIDEKGGFQLQVVAAGVFICVGIVLRQVARRATGAEALRSRPLLRMLLMSTCCSAAGAICLTVHLSVYMVNGYGLIFCEVLGQAFICGAKALLTLLQLLTAKGWALFYAPEELVQRQLMICILGGIILTSIACEIHADYFHDWSTALYLYESWPGMVILLLNVVLFAEAWRSMRETYRHETSEEVRIFYVVISCSSLLYFLALPVICVLAAAFDPWVRAKYVNRAEVASRFVTTLLLAFCLRPTRLDAMVNARLEEGLATVGEPRDDIDMDEDEGGRRWENDYKDGGAGYREASEDMPERLLKATGNGPAE